MSDGVGSVASDIAKHVAEYSSVSKTTMSANFKMAVMNATTSTGNKAAEYIAKSTQS